MATTTLLLPSVLSPSPSPSPLPLPSHHQTISLTSIPAASCSNSINNNNHALKLTSRRHTIGFGLVLTVFDVVTSAEAAECEFTVADSGLAFCDKLLGYGSQAEKGQLIKAHYVGKLESGTVFDSSYNRGKPLTFRIGVGEVIKGWDQGILGGDGVPPMLAGGKRTLKLPPELGYGQRGAGCRGGSCIIPPDSVLLFDVEFIGKA
ncbi:peptidyl-prolyl cis-trans isomerase FKBP13, chloroplastic-like [Bidens hawaiensis]|uniref:peptidyl-prolyl cis-trans isomerase FKBP13, chloroplastic-like n=1 Tax=Bidens hawaiensis TaxID=980011 RepID=UPI00404AA3DD